MTQLPAAVAAREEPLPTPATSALDGSGGGSGGGEEEEELLLNLEVQLAPGYSVTVPVRRSDEPSSLAGRFVRAYGLEAVPGIVAMLTRMIQEQVQEQAAALAEVAAAAEAGGGSGGGGAAEAGATAAVGGGGA